jgi:digeranylgeranylglycerophospholipid reductase
MKSAYDVIVVGAGPGGSIAAKIVAERGLEVILLEKRQEIGAPVRCAEGVGTPTLRRFIEPDPKWVAAEINCGRIFAPNGKCAKLEFPGAGLILERKIFDRRLAELAAEAGAEVLVKSRVTGVTKNNGCVDGITLKFMGKDYTLKSKVVIAADGVESQVGRWAGLNTVCKLVDLDVAVQYLMANVDVQPDCVDFFLGHQIAPRGYAWIFPKRERTANIGLGIGGVHSGKNGKLAIDYLNEFVKERFPKASIVSVVVGGIPVSGRAKQISSDGIMLVGDAAHQADPMSGGGITNAMIAAQIAAEVAVEAIQMDDVSDKMLKEYDKRWHKEVGRAFEHVVKLRDEIVKFSDEKLNELASLLDGKEKLTMVDVFNVAIRSNPKMLWELGQLVAMGWF